MLGYVVLIVVGTVLSMLLKRISNEDVMEQISEDKVLDKKSKNETIIVTSLFAILVGFWCIGWRGFPTNFPHLIYAGNKLKIKSIQENNYVVKAGYFISYCTKI